jgi:hypothetical protein
MPRIHQYFARGPLCNFLRSSDFFLDKRMNPTAIKSSFHDYVHHLTWASSRGRYVSFLRIAGQTQSPVTYPDSSIYSNLSDRTNKIFNVI